MIPFTIFNNKLVLTRIRLISSNVLRIILINQSIQLQISNHLIMAQLCACLLDIKIKFTRMTLKNPD